MLEAYQMATSLNSTKKNLPINNPIKIAIQITTPKANFKVSNCLMLNLLSKKPATELVIKLFIDNTTEVAINRDRIILV